MGGFSRRWTEAPGPNPLSMLLAEKKRVGASILDLTNTNPTRAGLPAVEGLTLPPVGPIPYSPDCRGLLAAREAVAAYYSREGCLLSPEDIFLTASTSEGYGFLFKLLTDPGDNILFPSPSYPLFEHLAAMESIEARPYPLARRADGGWTYAPDALRAAKDGRTRAVCLVSPNNPTGTVPDGSAWEAILAWCEGEGLPLILDEVFADYVWSGRRPLFPAREPGVPVFVLNGLSKILCAPQLKLAWTVLHAPEEKKSAVRERLDLICDTYLSVNTPVQLALPSLLGRREEIQSQVRARLAENLKHLAALLSPLRVLPGEGGWAQVIALPEGTDEEALVLRLLDEADVLAHPGYFFDIEGAHLVVSLLTPPGALARGLAAASALA